MLLINFKNYSSAFNQGEVLASKIEELSKEYSLKLFFSPPVPTLCKYTSNTCVISQHVDFGVGPKTTGLVTAEDLSMMGVKATLLNHSEHNVNVSVVESTINECKKNGVDVMLCFKNIGELDLFTKFDPTYYLYEPSSLIGGTDSVVEKEPEVILKIREVLPKGKFFIGAGINSESDFIKAYEMGVDGIGLASIVMASDNPLEKLTQIISWEKEYRK
jgi:triosephosphate isomerase